MPSRFLERKKQEKKCPAIILIPLALAIFAKFSSAHLDSGFNKDAGPYTFDVGWTPPAPNAGEPVLMAVNVVNAGTADAANVSSVWVRLDLKDQVHYAGTLALTNGSTSFTYVFPKAGGWTITLQADDYTQHGEIFVPGQPPTTETAAWMAAAALALIAAVLGYTLWKSRISEKAQTKKSR